MNVSIRRQGILIKNIAAAGSRLRIGSGSDCEVHLNDPFLSPLVAELVDRHGEWYIVDAGTSLQGVTKNGQPVIDEAIEPGRTYVVGAFELITDANRDLQTMATRPSGEPIPMTMVGVPIDDDPFPGTVIQSRLPNAAPPRAASAPQPLQFQPVSGAHAMPPQQVRARPVPAKRSTMFLLIAFIAVVTIVLGIGIIVVTSPKKPRAQTRTAAETRTASAAPTQSAATTTSAAPPAADGTQLASNLEVDKAFAAWEAAVAAGNADPALKERIANGALELGRAYAAANDPATAKRYFEKVVRYGAPDSAAVRYARARM